MNKIIFRQILISIIAIFFSLTNLICYANDNDGNDTVYTINYDDHSKVKSFSLKNISLQIQLYLGGKTVEKLTVKTDENQSFKISNRHIKMHKNLLVVAVHSIEGEPKDISCYGASLPGKTNIIVDCHSRSEKKHYH